MITTAHNGRCGTRLIGAVLLLLACSTFATPLRVTTWNLWGKEQAPGESSEVTNRVRTAAETLRNLNPDVILLQGVPNWQTSKDLALALKPAKYTVLVCSSFQDPTTGKLRSEQVAILAKRKAYFSWAKSWRPARETAIPGGYAFAAIQFGSERIGFFNVQLDPKLATDASSGVISTTREIENTTREQWSSEVVSIRSWVTNRIQAGVVAAAFPSGKSNPALAALLKTPFDETLTPPPLSERPGQSAEHFSMPIDLPFGWLVGLVVAQSPVTGDLDLSVAKPVTRSIAPASSVSTQAQTMPPAILPSGSLLANGSPVNRAQPPSSKLAGQSPFWWGIAVAGIAFVMLVAAVVFRRRRRAWRRRRLTDRGPVNEVGSLSAPTTVVIISATTSTSLNVTASSRPVVNTDPPGGKEHQSELWRARALAAEQRAERMTTALRTGVIPHLNQWLKEKLVRKLITDRAALLKIQEKAIDKTEAMEERLGKIEVQIQKQNSAYQQRIEELTKELLEAKAENRELIQAQINQVRAEMDAARARSLAQAKLKD